MQETGKTIVRTSLRRERAGHEAREVRNVLIGMLSQAENCATEPEVEPNGAIRETSN